MGRIRDIRNDELIRAAIAALADRGYAQVTMSDIAARAGATAPSITYYFGSKQRLMEQTMRHLLRLLRTAHVDLLRSGKNRLEAAVLANFDPALFTRDHCAVWVQFWANAPHDPVLARLYQINRKRVESHLLGALRNDAARSASDIQAWMDGVWLSVAQGQTAPDVKGIQAQALSMLDRF